MARQMNGPRSVGLGFEIALTTDGRLSAVAPWSATQLSYTRENLYRAQSPAQGDGDRTLVRVVDVSSGRVIRDLRMADAGMTIVKDPTVTRFGRDTTDRLAGLLDDRGRFVRLMSGVYPQVIAAAFDQSASRLATWSWSNRIDVWDLHTGVRLAAFNGHGDRINAVVFIPNSTRVVSASRDGTVCLWDVATRMGVGVITTRDPAHAIAISRDGALLAIAAGNGAIGVWNAATRQPLWAGSHNAQVDALAFSPDGRVLVSGSRDRSAGVWRASDGLPISRLRGHGGWVQAVGVRKSGEIVTGSADRTIRLWTPGDAPVWICGGHSGPVTTVGFASDDRTIYSSAEDGTIALWRVGEAEAIRTWKGADNRSPEGLTILSVDASADGTLLASGGSDHAVRLWAAADGSLVRELKGHTDEVHTVAFSLRGDVLVSASADKTIRAWDPSTGALLAVMKGHDSDVSWLGFTPDARTIVSVSPGGTVHTWQGQTFAAESSWSLSGVEVTRVALSPDGERVAMGGRDGLVRLAERRSGRSVGTLKGAREAITALTFSPDGTRLLAGSLDGSLRIYDTLTFERVYAFGGATVPELGAFVPLTKPGTRSFLAEFFEPSPRPNFPASAAFSRDGERIVTGWSDGTIRVLTARRTPVVGGRQ